MLIKSKQSLCFDCHEKDQYGKSKELIGHEPAKDGESFGLFRTNSD